MQLLQPQQSFRTTAMKRASIGRIEPVSFAWRNRGIMRDILVDGIIMGAIYAVISTI
jgi:hypothetical protein